MGGVRELWLGYMPLSLFLPIFHGGDRMDGWAAILRDIYRDIVKRRVKLSI